MIPLVRPECPNPAALKAEKYDDPINKDALRKSTFGKCMYCESKIEHISYAEIEHIKPKKKYTELEFVWENLGFSCKRCNTNKGQKFDEDIPFINPYEENPDEYIVFLGFFVYAKQGSERGEYTIRELDLNRSGLIESRKEKFDKINLMITAAFRTKNESLRNQAIKELYEQAEKDKEYSAVVKSLLIAQEII